MDRSFVAATVALLVVLVPVLRRCTWRTAAALALVCATVTAVGPMTPWSQFTREMTMGIVYGRLGTDWQGLGGWIRVLGVLGAAAAFILTRLPETAPPRGGRRLAWTFGLATDGRGISCAAAIPLGLAALGTLWEYISVESLPTFRDDDGMLIVRSATAGLELTLLAAFAGTACAARAYFRLRTRPVPPTSPETP